MSIGTSPPRLDAVAKVTGRARYTEDMGLLGMRHAVYVRSPLAHAKVLSINTQKALALPGVEAIFTHADVPHIPFATAGHPYSLDPAGSDVADRLLLTDHVRYHGDEVAIVVARDDLTARKAAKLVEVQYEELPVLTDPLLALAPDAPQLHAWCPTGNLIKEHHVSNGLDAETTVADTLAKKGVVCSALLETCVQQHCHLEGFTAYAHMEEDGNITVYSSTQIPHICRRVVAQALNMDWSRVRIIKPYIGGGFGAKQDVVLEPMVAFLTWKLGGRPVSITLTREESMACTRTRHAFRIEGRAAATPDGILTALELDVLSNTGAYASHGHSIVSAGASKMAPLYPRAVYSVRARTVYTNYPVAGAMRGYGAPQVAFAVECLVEDAARATGPHGMDSVDFRLKNVVRSGDLHPLKKKPIDTAEVAACLTEGRTLFDWDARKKACIRQGPLRQGVGVACFAYGSSTYPVSVEAAGVRLILNQDGRVTLMAGATEIGQGADTALAQMAAHTLGMDVDNFRVVSTQDTDISPFDTGAYASRQSYVVSNAMVRCAAELRHKILEQAAAMLDITADNLTIHGKHIVRINETNKLLSLHDLALDAYYHKERGCQITAEVSHKTKANAPCFGCTFIHAEVDIPLCRVRILDVLNVHDSGIIINPQLAAGQVQGGVAMALGWALGEELLMDAKSGKILNNNLLDYKFPTSLDLPDVRSAFVQPHEPSSGYGNKALGEPPIVSPAPALRNAVLDATGVAVNELPLGPKTLFRYFTKAGLL